MSGTQYTYSNATSSSSTASGVVSTAPPEQISVTASRNTDIRRVRITPKAGIKNLAGTSNILAPLVTTNGFIFPYTPSITWDQSIEYGTQSLVHSNQDFRYYIRGKSVSFTITGDFTAENNDTALYTLGCLHFLRAVSKMHYGGFGSGSSTSTDSALGAPPPILTLSGYGAYMMNKLPVILEKFNMSWDNNVDYVKVVVDGLTNWIPITCSISVTLTVQNTPQKLRQFSYSDFASGKLMQQGGWF